MNPDRNAKPIAAPRQRRPWSAPALRAVIPSKRTAGGNIPAGFEGPVYDLS